MCVGIAALAVALVPLDASAHGGGLDSNGGHYNRKTGEYHCHRAGCEEPRGGSGKGRSRRPHEDPKPTKSKQPNSEQKPADEAQR